MHVQMIFGDQRSSVPSEEIYQLIFLLLSHFLQICIHNVTILYFDSLETFFFIFCFYPASFLIYFMHNIHKIPFEKQSHLKHMTSEELKALLSKLENQHDILQATNEELTIQISDLRNAVKCVEAERKENVTYEVEKKKELENKIESLEKGLKYAKQNKSYETMEVYKAMME